MCMVKLVLSNIQLCLKKNKRKGETSILQKIRTLLPLLIASVAVTACSGTRPQNNAEGTAKATSIVQTSPDTLGQVPTVFEKRSPKGQVAQNSTRGYGKSRHANAFNQKLSNAALGRLNSKIRYDGSYIKIGYPGGDVSPHIGVCTDVVIRSYRKLGIDLQEQVHRDMSAAFNTYPNPRKWGLSKPDTNIDHRRVYNLRNFFQRRGAALPITLDPSNYKPGDIVSWMVGPDLPHIGVVVNKRSKADPNRFMIVHNIARGPEMEDVLFAFRITGHYRYTPAHMGNIPSGIYTQNKDSLNNRGMSYDQLIQAANILGTRVDSVAQAEARPKGNNQQSDQSRLDQVVRLNSINGPAVKAKDSSVTLANLSDIELQSLLTKKN